MCIFKFDFELLLLVKFRKKDETFCFYCFGVRLRECKYYIAKMHIFLSTYNVAFRILFWFGTTLILKTNKPSYDEEKTLYPLKGDLAQL